MSSYKQRIARLSSLFVILLFLTLPLASALEISNVQATQVTDTSALISWQTDQPADTFIGFGTTKTTLEKKGDPSPVTDHQLPLFNLKSKTQYFFNVESGKTTDDNGGKLYSFETQAPDTTAPEIELKFPEMIAGNQLTLKGSTELGATATIYVNGNQAGIALAKKLDDTEAKGYKHPGLFTFSGVILQNNKENTVKVEVVDSSGNKASANAKIFADTEKPKITMGKVPSLVGDISYKIDAIISESVSYEIRVDNKSVKKGEGDKISESISLKEGKNNVQIIVIDKAGWEVVEQFSISTDTRDPTVKFTVAKGNEYYQGSAESSISGTTESGAKVFLYIYRPSTVEYNPDFSRAWMETTANDKGEFTFEEVNFESQPLSLKSLAPKKVPQGLQTVTLQPVAQAGELQRKTVYIYVIAEDQSGKTGYQQTPLNINSCFSGDSVFEVNSVTQFQAPLRLNPQLLDEGREVATVVFNFSYRGSASPIIDPTTGNQVEPAFKITDVLFDPACTQGMLKDPETKLGCNILPQRQQSKTPNNDNTAYMLTYNLKSSETLSKKESGYWDEFKKRQIMFPLKITVRYQERESVTTGSVLGSTTTATYGSPKTQVSCQQLGYFVDIPVDSSEYIPDWLADEGIATTTYVSEKIEAILPILEKTILVTGVGCITSFVGRIGFRFARIFTSKMEVIQSKAAVAAKTKEEGKDDCPLNQEDLILESTRQEWLKLKNNGALNGISLPKGDWENEANTLDKRCPSTSKLWKAEAALDQAYRWSCDRVLCRAAPAAWTASAEKSQVDIAVLNQEQCTVTSRGIPLQKVENCQDQISKSPTVQVSQGALDLKKKGAFTCYRNPLTEQLYYVDPADIQSSDGKNVKLKWLSPVAGLELNSAFNIKNTNNTLYAYKGPNSQEIIVGTDQSCAAVCSNPRAPGYKSDGCYDEVKAGLTGQITIKKNGNSLPTGARSAGYTQDCFVKSTASGSNTGLQQCVCVPDKTVKVENLGNAREAIKEQTSTTGTVSEDWVYRQDQLYKTNPTKGTFYPEWRYYSGRDTSATFGLNHVLDTVGTPTIPTINPNTQHLGAFQSVCLSGISARLVLTNNMLKAFNSCIEEAKTGGFKDAGVCKTLFSQQICGLAYKGISYLTNSCEPLNWQDELKGGTTIDTLGQGTKAFYSSIPEAMSSSTNDLRSDYANANVESFFSGGAQGFAQSMCMAAFGFDLPSVSEFILDSAYAFPMKTTAHALPREREFASFDPVRGTAVYNYNLGALIIPGCKIKSATASLVCIGPEDQNRPGVQCGDQGCDCVHATTTSGFEGEKTKQLNGGTLYNLKQLEPISIQILSPQKINSNFRYDHVLIDLRLDPNEKKETCFDEGYLDGKFYFPIQDASPPGVVTACQTQFGTGKFFCAGIQGLFGTGGSYLQDPYFSCYDKTTQSWASCTTPNLFTKNDEIRVKTHVFSDGTPACLKITERGLQSGQTNVRGIQPLPQNLPGSFQPEWNLGIVTPNLFTGASNSIVLTSDSDQGCSSNINYLNPPPTTPITSSPTYNFGYEVLPGGFKVTVPSGVLVDSSSGFSVVNNILKKGTQEIFPGSDLVTVPFTFNGFKVSGLIGTPTNPQKKQCTYQVRGSASGSFAQTEKSFTLTAELFKPDANGQCYNVNQLIKAPAFGKSQVSIPIKIQLEPVKSQIVSQMHNDFMAGSCNAVQQQASAIINYGGNDLQDAKALYYSTACYVVQGQSQWAQRFKNEVCTRTDIFLNRKDANNQTMPSYLPAVTSTTEYNKMVQYMTTIRGQAGC